MYFIVSQIIFVVDIGFYQKGEDQPSAEGTSEPRNGFEGGFGREHSLPTRGLFKKVT